MEQVAIPVLAALALILNLLADGRREQRIPRRLRLLGIGLCTFIALACLGLETIELLARLSAY